MNKILIGIFCSLAIFLTPHITMAKPHDSANGGKNASMDTSKPNPAAYEHADDNANFLRDTHDLGKNKENELKGMDKDKYEGKDKETGVDEDAGKVKDKEKGKKPGNNKGN